MKTRKIEMKRSLIERLVPQKNNIVFALLLFFAVISISTNAFSQRIELQVNLNLPSWAPYYNNSHLVRYYYLPDIECYYDVRAREFIYMEDGEWMFDRTLPPVYAWFNLNSCFIVALDNRVVEPWRHFHYYVSHYPRYYYRTVYRDRDRDRDRPLRGFNENERDVVYNRPSDRDNNTYDKRNDSRREENNRFENRNENEKRQEMERGGDAQERRSSANRASEPVKYYGREVGRPVRVQRNMKRSEETKVREEKEVKQYRQR